MPRAVITLVHASACHFCADAEVALADLAGEFPIRVDRVDADSDVGRILVGAHRPAMLPLVLLDGAFFSAGRLPRHKLRARLVGRATAVSRS
jgi:hypothetical protein